MKSLLPAAPSRLWEVDALRGVCVVLMVGFHAFWDMDYFDLIPVDVGAQPWQIFARSVGSVFIFVMGISLTLRAARTGSPLMWAVRRGAFLFALGMLVTLVTYIAFSETYVRFGILHLLGSALILAALFLRAPRWLTLCAGLLIVAGGFYLNYHVYASFPWLIWLGVLQPGVRMVDYYPLLPWSGFALLGVSAGTFLYPGGMGRFAPPDLTAWLPIRLLQLLGRHSLLLYLIHQPILLGIVFFLSTSGLLAPSR